MNEIEVLAVFSAAEQAHLALERLEDLQHRGVRAKVAAQCAVRAATPRQLQQMVADTLRRLGALDVTTRLIPPDSDWMSHQNGRVTGTGVEPGAGDSEAGWSEDRWT
jgi:hypothetical protein